MDTIIINGLVHTMDPARPTAEAIAIQDGAVTALGSSEQIRSLAAKDTKVIDAAGRLVLPGFTDSHLHLMHTALAMRQIDLMNITSLDQMARICRNALSTRGSSNGDWLIGSGWNQELWKNPKMPTAEDLDRISRHIPIALTRVCHHLVVVNTKALERLGLLESHPDGLLMEVEQSLVWNSIPVPDRNMLKELILSVCEHALTKGITSLHTDDFSAFPTLDPAEYIQAYRELAASQSLPLRIHHQCLFLEPEDLQSFLDKGYRTGDQMGLSQIGPVKLLLDGSLGARSARMKKPYADDPSAQGMLLYTEEKLLNLMRLAHQNDMQIAIHCIGDGALELALDCFQQISDESPRQDHRHGIVHCQITDTAQLRRIAALQLITYVEPIFVASDHPIVENRVGRVLASTSYNWRAMIDLGIPMSGGSDSPVEPIDILPNLYCAVTRKDLAGRPESGWYPEHCITVDEAVRAFTLEGAYAGFQEMELGSLAVGKRADLVILDRDIYQIPADQIKEAQVDLTMVDGQVKFNR